MKGWEPEETNDSPDLTPMIDVVFLLIVFFLVVAQRMSEQYVEIEKLAVAKMAEVKEQPPPRTIISITQPPGGAPVYYLGQQQTYLDNISKHVSDHEKQKVFLRVDQRVTHGIVREVLREIGAGGQVDVIFGVFEK